MPIAPARVVARASLAGLLAIVVATCSTPGGTSSPQGSGGVSGTQNEPSGQPQEGSSGPTGTLRLGYFPNVTHAAALVGVESGTFRDALGTGVTLEPSSFNAGGAASEALLNGAIDATYIGPNPAINAFAQSSGAAIRIIAGATSGGAFLVVKPEITSAEDLRGKKLATPQLGNTQDVALRTWLAENGLTTDTSGGGDVSILPQENAQTLQTFTDGQIDGAWVPEPWATRLVQEGGGTILVDEKTLWPEGKYVTTHLIVRTDYLQAHPDIIRALLAGHIEATDFVNDNPDEAKDLVNQGIEAITGNTVAEDVLSAAWENLEFTVDPIASSLRTSAEHAEQVGLLDPVDLTGIYDLAALNELLTSAGRETVAGE
jgi:NitT/TauT family transport system substrate-binding protein